MELNEDSIPLSAKLDAYIKKQSVKELKSTWFYYGIGAAVLFYNYHSIKDWLLKIKPDRPLGRVLNGWLDVRFPPISGHWLSVSGCPLCAISRHCVTGRHQPVTEIRAVSMPPVNAARRRFDYQANLEGALRQPELAHMRFYRLRRQLRAPSLWPA